MEYRPHPEDTSKIVLDDDMNKLVEYLAKNTHESWAKQRISDGWKYGPNRNDDKKEHPCLIPYEELSEEEKEYDRITSTETIKLIIKLGYKIEKNK